MFPDKVGKFDERALHESTDFNKIQFRTIIVGITLDNTYDNKV